MAARGLLPHCSCAARNQAAGIAEHVATARHMMAGPARYLPVVEDVWADTLQADTLQKAYGCCSEMPSISGIRTSTSKSSSESSASASTRLRPMLRGFRPALPGSCIRHQTSHDSGAAGGSGSTTRRQGGRTQAPAHAAAHSAVDPSILAVAAMVYNIEPCMRAVASRAPTTLRRQAA